MAVIYDEFCGNCMINHEMTNMRNHYKALYLTNFTASFPYFGGPKIKLLNLKYQDTLNCVESVFFEVATEFSMKTH